MKGLRTFSFIILIVIAIACNIQTAVSEFCYEFASPLSRKNGSFVNCKMVKSYEKRQSLTSDNMFNVDFQCGIGDKLLCNRVKNTFLAAGEYITATLNLNQQVKVNAKFTDFCRDYQFCDENQVILGAAGPSRMIPNTDPDGKSRLYPQALHKQLNSQSDHLEYASSDITAIFNSKMSYWFKGDSQMAGNQVDLLYVVIHELTHGLGFINSWNDYMNIQALTPTLGIGQNAIATQSLFVEYVFDKSLVLLPSGTSLSSITDQLNQFQIPNVNSDQDFINAFRASPQFPIAQSIYNNATTPNTIGFLLNSQPNTPLSSDNVVILETSLNPYQPSSSIGHVDLKSHLNSADFLMMYTYPPGKTLDDMMANAGSTTTTGPMGPQLRRVLGQLGYSVKQNYNPPNIQSIGSESSNTSRISFNIMLSLICILLAFLNLFYN